MTQALWIAKTGLDAQQTRMAVTANNLANVNTAGFKRDRASFEDLLYQTVRQPGGATSEQTQLPTGLQMGLELHLASLIPERPAWLQTRRWVVPLYYVTGLGLGMVTCGTRSHC